MKSLLYLSCSVLLLLIACVSLPPASPQSDRSSLIGISVKVKGPIFTEFPGELYFIKLSEGEDSHLSANAIIKSNYKSDRHYYLLNAEPGRYIAVAAVDTRESEGREVMGITTDKTIVTCTFYFPLGMIRLTDVTIRQGDIAYMGDYTVNAPLNLKFGIAHPDEAQYHYCKRLNPELADPTVSMCLLNFVISTLFGDEDLAEAVRLKNHKKDPGTEREFWLHTKKDFAGDPSQGERYRERMEFTRVWLDIIDGHLKKLP